MSIAEGREESCRFKVRSQEGCTGERFWVGEVVVRRGRGIIVAELKSPVNQAYIKMVDSHIGPT